MSLQSILNQQSLDKLPVVLKAILNAEDEETANQMSCYTLREMMNTFTPFDEMSDDERRNFQVQLVTMFKIKGWI